MHSEIGFIFSPGLENFNNRNVKEDGSLGDMNKGDIYNRISKIKPRKKNTTNLDLKGSQFVKSGQNTDKTDPATESAILVYKNPKTSGTVEIINYLKNNVYMFDDSNEDPYISLINYFTTQQTKALKLKAGDFAYLKDLGVYPINRLWILRRFSDNAIVPNNLLAWGKAVEPISTVIGWIKPKDDSELLSFSFNEVWTDQTETLDKVINNILKDMGIKGAENIMSVPGWSQGLLWGMLNAMGLTDDYSATFVPTGDPNVLRTAKMRDTSGQQSLSSTLNLNLETSYEQKYINGIDPGMAMLDILSNLFKMGTSEQRFMLGNSPALQKLIGAVNGSSSDGKDNFVNFLKAMVDAFVQGVTQFVNDLGGGVKADTNGKQKGGTDNDGKSKLAGGFKMPDPSAMSVGDAINNISTTLLAGTVFKFRWPLKGSIALMCGINTTPWHLTIGNPYSPIINIGNIVVKNVDVKMSDDLGFNDMSARIDVKIDCELGRPLGRSELEKMFNNGYKRVYSINSLNGGTEPSNNSTASGINSTVGVSQDQSQPSDARSYINVDTVGGGGAG